VRQSSDGDYLQRFQCTEIAQRANWDATDGKYIEETILSVLNQGYPNVEYIIMDGASTDETPQILDRYRDRVALIVSEPDAGQSNAINKGMAKASGQIVTWVNSDDMLAPGALAAAALAFETSGADMIAGVCQLYRDGRTIHQHLTSCADGPLELNDLLDVDHCWNAGQFFFQPEVMFTRELWMRAGGHVSEKLYYVMDYELWLRFAKAGAKIHVIGRPIAWFRVHEEQKTFQGAFIPELTACRDAFMAEHGIVSKPRENPPRARARLRVTLLNDHGGYHGAGIAHVRLARALAWAGHEVNLVSILDSPGNGIESGEHTTRSIADQVIRSTPDLVIVGNLHSAAVDPMLLHELSVRFPTLIVLHDFWLLTGRCAYTGDCEKYLTGCDAACPTPNEYPPLPPEEIAEAWYKKRALLRADSRPALLANSNWTASFARNVFAKPLRSGEKAPPIEVFQLSFPLDILRPRDRFTSREALGLPLDRFIVVLPGSLGDPRKGGQPLVDALARLAIPNLLIVALGWSAPGVETSLNLVQLGHIHDQQRVAMVYSAADVIAAPSSAETFGQVLIEAIACGTAVAGYPVTAVHEAVWDGVTGVIAAEASPASLAAAIHYLYSHPQVRREISRWGRIFVENEWSEFSAYRHLVLVLRRLGLADALQLPRKLGFLADPPEPPLLTSAWSNGSGWRPREGFSYVESAPHLGLYAFRWAQGPYAVAEVSAAGRGIHHAVVTYRNPLVGQRLTLSCNGMTIGTYDLPQTGYETSRFLRADLLLEAGINQLQFKFSRWLPPGNDPRLVALIVADIRIEPAARQPEPEEMVAAVWGGVGR
jgi:glycosyltransferase involved in cell wall biosynthesis